MRRVFGVLLLCSSLALIAATRPPAKPTPKPSPTPAPTATPFTSGAPSVLVYPFDTQGEVQQNVGGAVASIFSQVFVQSGGLTVLPIGAGIVRADYLKHAREQHADYYISGYLTPIGNSAAVVEQVVSVDTGVIVYSQTAQIYSVPDVASQALSTRHVILELSGRETADMGPESGSATPAPSATNGASVSLGGLGGIVQSLFHRGGSGATPAPTPAVAASKPERSVLVTRVSGNAQPGMLTTATQSLLRALDAGYTTHLTNAYASNAARTADSICGNARDNTIAAGLLNIEQEHQRYGVHNVNAFTLTVYTCFGAPLFQTTERNSDLASAINAAVTAYQKAHPDNS